MPKAAKTSASSKSTVPAAPAVSFPVPADAAGADQFVRDIGLHRRELERIKAKMDEELNQIRAKYVDDERTHAEAEELLERGLRTWCEAHRAELLADGGKSHRFAAGVVQWKKKPANVIIEDAKKVIADLLERGKRFRHFIRTVREINKQAVLADPERAAEIEGIRIEPGTDDFIIKPFGAQLEQPLQAAAT